MNLEPNNGSVIIQERAPVSLKDQSILLFDPYYLLSILDISRHKRFKHISPVSVWGPAACRLESRRAWGSKYLKNVREALVLVQGTGTGWDVISWAKLRPRQIIATDMFPFEDSWEDITRYCYDHYKVRVDFRVSAIEDVSF